MTRWTTLREVLIPLTKRSPLQQGWSPQCERSSAPPGEWGVLKTTAIQPGHFDDSANKLLPPTLVPKPELAVQAGDLLLTCAGPRSRCGVPALVRQTRRKLMISGKMYRFRTVPHMDPRFLEAYLLSPNAQQSIDEMKTGINESGLNLTKERFLRLPVPAPSMAEQRRIVEVLEARLSQLDSGLDKLKTVQARLETLESSYVDASVDDSQLLTLENLLVEPLINGRSVPSAEVGFPVLRLTAMRSGNIDLNERKMGAWSETDAEPFRVAKGDIFVSRGNGSLHLVGRAARVVDPPDPVAFPDTMIRIRPDSAIIRQQFLIEIWNSRFVRRQIERRARTTAGIFKVNQGDLRSVEVPVPSMPAQASFLQGLNEWRQRAAAGQRSLDLVSDRSGSLRRSLLGAAFSGQLISKSSDIVRTFEEGATGQDAFAG